MMTRHLSLLSAGNNGRSNSHAANNTTTMPRSESLANQVFKSLNRLHYYMALKTRNFLLTMMSTGLHYYCIIIILALLELPVAV